MFRIDDPSAATTLPTPEAAGTEGYWTEGNPAGGVAATLERASWFNMIQEELRAIVVAGGLTPSKTTYNQVLTAINSLRQRPASYAIDTGTANAYAIALSPAPLALTDGMMVNFRAANANTGASTLNVSGLGTFNIYGIPGPLQGGEIVANGYYEVMYNAQATVWMLMGQYGGAMALGPNSYVPNPSQFDSTTKLATTQWVHANGIAASGVAIVTASTSLTAAANAGGTIVGNATSAITTTLPSAASCPAGVRIEFLNINSGVMTVARAGTDTIVTSRSLTSLALSNGDTLTLESNGSNTWYAVGGAAQSKSLQSNFAAYQSTGQSISASTLTAISFQTSLFDDLSEYSTSTGKFTALNAGTYQFFAGIHGNSTSAAIRTLMLFVNGVERVRLQETTGSATNVTIAGASGPVSLAANDYVQVYYNSGVADTLVTGQALTYFSGSRIK